MFEMFTKIFAFHMGFAAFSVIAVPVLFALYVFIDWDALRARFDRKHRY